VLDFLAQSVVTGSQQAQGVTGCGVGVGKGPGSSTRQVLISRAGVRARYWSRSCGDAVTKMALIWFMAWVRALTAESLAILRMRIISMRDSPAFGGRSCGVG
jgi:hypothetical protein